MSIIFNFILCLVLTIITEGIVIFVKYGRWDYVYYSFLCNVLTNPILNLLLCILVWALGSEIYLIALIILEIIVLIVEVYIYRILCKFTKKEALKLSLLLNISSYLIGVVIFMIK